MAIEAPLSKFKKQNLLIIAGVLVVVGVWFAYDGYMNEDFQKKHTVDGVPDSTLSFNQKSPPFFILGALVLGIYFVVIKDRKISVDETTLHANKLTIPLDNIEKIDKTHFDKKGYFMITYTDGGQTKELKLSDRTYDNMPAVLDHIVSKMN